MEANKIKLIKNLGIGLVLASTAALADTAPSSADGTTNRGELPANTTQQQQQGVDRTEHMGEADHMDATPTITDTAETGTDWKAFNNPEKVKEVQKALSSKGMDVGETDGVIGEKTRKSLRKFQQDNNLPVTGSLNRETLDRLNIDYDDAKANQADDTYAE